MSFVTIATSTEPPRLTKLWQIDENTPRKYGAGNMTAGEVHRVPASTPAELVAILEQLTCEQALMFGLPPADRHPVVTSEKLTKTRKSAPLAIARTKDTFTWNAGPGWLLLDYDPAPGAKALSREEWLAHLYEVAPALACAPTVWGTSSSSEIWNTETGEQVTGVRGQRLYILVADARDIPRAGAALFDRLWLAGFGYYMTSKSGQLLKRADVDASVWQTNRLDFAAPPVCLPPLECRRPARLVLNPAAAPMDLVAAIPSLTQDETERLAALRSVMAGDDDLLAAAHLAREAWIDERLNTLAGLPKNQQEEARERLREAVERGRLFGDFELVYSRGQAVTVGDLLDNPDRWHGERFHDPLEPDYSNRDSRIAIANLKSGGAPYIYSHAHGGICYRLMRPVVALKLVQGELPRVLPKILERLRQEGEIFERAGLLVRLADGELVAVERPWLQTHLETVFQLLMFDGYSKTWKSKNCPDWLAGRLVAARGAWDLPKVSVVVAFPVMRPNGSVIQRPGFDPETGLLYLDNNPSRPRAHTLDRQGLTKVLHRIWEPFDGFPFAESVSRGVFLAALLTTVTRPALPTAPAFLVRAHTPGTGKTLLSECLMLLVGARPSAMPLPDDAAEAEKRMFSKLLTGCPGLILDNLTGTIDGAAMCAFLTNAEPEGRILGKSETPRVINRALWVLNGNNVGAGGDTFRRILPITLDPDCESPETRSFRFNPRDVVRERLDVLRADLLSVLLTYQSEGAPVVGAGALGSFDEWERLVRQCVCWLIREGVTPAPMVDPVEVLKLNKAEDPRHQQHVEVVEAWHDLYDDRVVQVREIAALVARQGYQCSARERVFIDAVKDIAPPRDGFNGRYFSGWLRRHKGRVVKGLRLDSGDPSRKEPGWYVRHSH